VWELTGRTKICEYYWDGWLNRPFLGYGFSVGEKNSAVFGWNIDAGGNSSSHNIFISVLINTGLIGFIIWMRFLIVLFIRTFKQAAFGNKFASILFPTLVGIMLNANSKPALGSGWGVTDTTCYAVVIFALWGLNPSRKQLSMYRIKRMKALYEAKKTMGKSPEVVIDPLIRQLKEEQEKGQ
jgi:hypothetical protein